MQRKTFQKDPWTLASQLKFLQALGMWKNEWLGYFDTGKFEIWKGLLTYISVCAMNPFEIWLKLMDPSQNNALKIYITLGHIKLQRKQIT